MRFPMARIRGFLNHFNFLDRVGHDASLATGRRADNLHDFIVWLIAAPSRRITQGIYRLWVWRAEVRGRRKFPQIWKRERRWKGQEPWPVDQMRAQRRRKTL